MEGLGPGQGAEDPGRGGRTGRGGLGEDRGALDAALSAGMESTASHSKGPREKPGLQGI